jgi:hypothetical protein
MLTLSALESRYLYRQVTATDQATGTALDVTGDPVAWAFLPNGTTLDDTATWHAGDWEGTSARILIGPAGTITLTPGYWDVYTQITDNPETPIAHDTLRIT